MQPHEILIKPKGQKLFTIEEIEDLCSRAFISGNLHNDLRDKMTIKEDFESWFKDNIK